MCRARRVGTLLEVLLTVDHHALVGFLYIKINIPKVPTPEDCRLPIITPL